MTGHLLLTRSLENSHDLLIRAGFVRQVSVDSTYLSPSTLICIVDACWSISLSSFGDTSTREARKPAKQAHVQAWFDVVQLVSVTIR